jgi:hypothetical protein
LSLFVHRAQKTTACECKTFRFVALIACITLAKTPTNRRFNAYFTTSMNHADAITSEHSRRAGTPVAELCE